MTEGPAIRILHLSDLAFDESQAWRLGPILSKLVEYLRSAGHGVDLVAITGDLTATGATEEYALARTWIVESLLPALGLQAQALFLTPGSGTYTRWSSTRAPRPCASPTSGRARPKL